MKELHYIKTWLSQKDKDRKRGRNKKGCMVLFDGPSGDNKLKAAEDVAAHSGLVLHRIDLSKVISKYIGETEKNLNQLFREAKGKDWILFFDEADALFGKRTDVKDSHDRHANRQVKYILDKLQAYRGLIILSSNRKNNIDPAFLRRMQYVISFACP